MPGAQVNSFLSYAVVGVLVREVRDSRRTRGAGPSGQSQWSDRIGDHRIDPARRRRGRRIDRLGHHRITGALVIVAACYATAMLSTLLIPKRKPVKAHVEFSFAVSVKTFAHADRRLLKSARAARCLPPDPLHHCGAGHG